MAVAEKVKSAVLLAIPCVVRTHVPDVGSNPDRVATPFPVIVRVSSTPEVRLNVAESCVRSVVSPLLDTL
jgi:hypothetical protein